MDVPNPQLQISSSTTPNIAEVDPLEILTILNAHPRDKNIVFEPIEHKYTICGDGSADYVSVTTYNSSHFEHFDPDDAISKMRNGRNWNPDNKYYNMTDEEIKKLWTTGGAEASGFGEKMHASLELFMNNSRLPYPYTHRDLLHDYVAQYHAGKINLTDPASPYSTTEWKYFLNYLNDNPTMLPHRTEWRIYDEDLKLAGSIDMMYRLGDGTFAIFDWKFTKEMILTPKYKKYAITECISHFYDTNYWHYVLQLNTYRRILERKYGIRVTHLVLVRIHSNATNYELFPLPMIDKEMDGLVELRLKQVASGNASMTQPVVSKSTPTPKRETSSNAKPVIEIPTVTGDNLLAMLMQGIQKM